jgi:dynactin 1
MEIELQALKEGGTSEGGGVEAKKSLDVLQLEKHNERLKEALIKYVAQSFLSEAMY